MSPHYVKHIGSIWQAYFYQRGLGNSHELKIPKSQYIGSFAMKKKRSMTFAAMMRQEMGWFDDEKNSFGALSARLSSDASSVQGVSHFYFIFMQIISLYSL